MIKPYEKTSEPRPRRKRPTAEQKRQVLAKAEAILDQPEGEFLIGLIEVCYRRIVEQN